MKPVSNSASYYNYSTAKLWSNQTNVRVRTQVHLRYIIVHYVRTCIEFSIYGNVSRQSQDDTDTGPTIAIFMSRVQKSSTATCSDLKMGNNQTNNIPNLVVQVFIAILCLFFCCHSVMDLLPVKTTLWRRELMGPGLLMAPLSDGSPPLLVAPHVYVPPNVYVPQVATIIACVCL